VHVAAIVVAWLVGGAANAVQNVGIRSLMRSRTVDAERGRVAAAVAAALQSANVLGLGVGGGVVDLLGARTSLTSAGGAHRAGGRRNLGAGP